MVRYTCPNCNYAYLDKESDIKVSRTCPEINFGHKCNSKLKAIVIAKVPNKRPLKKKNTEFLTTTLTKEIFDKVNKLAKNKGISKAQLTREIIESYLKQKKD